jgi:hypothetical protein
MIEPTIGRIVWFHPLPTAAYPKVDGQPHGAMIAFVKNDTTVNLTVSDYSGETYAARHVRLLQDDEPAPVDEPYAEWMPYQRGQAARADALAQQLKDRPGGETGGSGAGTAAGTEKPQGSSQASDLPPAAAPLPGPNAPAAPQTDPEPPAAAEAAQQGDRPATANSAEPAADQPAQAPQAPATAQT